VFGISAIKKPKLLPRHKERPGLTVSGQFRLLSNSHVPSNGPQGREKDIKKSADVTVRVPLCVLVLILLA
jgi:hypothetical protein